MRCICGSEQFDKYEKAGFHVTTVGESLPTSISFVRCRECSVVRQERLPFSNDAEYEAFYAKYPPTNPSYTAKDWDHDLRLARERCDIYNLERGHRLSMLDVGCGSGAFVHECRRRGHASFGCELATYHYSRQSEFIYHQKFESINFPTDEFDIVTSHDVLEHSLDPVTMLKEMFRVTKQFGQCIIDYPRFFHVSGTHHWKDIEHIYMFSDEYLVKLLNEVGFAVESVEHPIESKSVFYCIKPQQIRKRVLVPPGIGDSYWSIVKMQAFMKRENLDIVDVIPVSNKENKYNGHERSVPFIRMFPFMNATGATVANHAKQQKIWNEAYAQQGRTIFKNVMGFEYFLSYNGHLRVGKQLEEIDPFLACNWHPEMFVSLEQELYRQSCIDKYGKYFVCYFPFYGTYDYWTRQFPISEVAETIRKIKTATNMTPIITGAGWDRDDDKTKQLVSLLPKCVNLTGSTTLDEVFGLLKGAEIVLGYPSGLTIMAAVFGVKTLIVWNPYYNIDFAWYCVPPDTRQKNYFIDFTNLLTSDRLSSEVIDLVETGTVEAVKYPPAFDMKAARNVAPGLRTPPIPQTTKSITIEKHPTVDHSKEKSVTVMCVLKSGGDFVPDHVLKLKNMVSRHSTVPHRFICLTDMDVKYEGVETQPLLGKLSGWWSKLELFLPNRTDTDHIVYFDLDTVIVNNIDDILMLQTEFAALGGFVSGPNRCSKENFGSGLLVWRNHNAFSFLHDEFKNQFYRHGDQEYIVTSLIAHGIKYATLQELTSGIYSYKRNCLATVPNDAKVICFHGKPRPFEAAKSVSWIKQYWC